MARALRAWAINRGGKDSVRNLRYGPRTRLVRGMDSHLIKQDRIHGIKSSQKILEIVLLLSPPGPGC